MLHGQAHYTWASLPQPGRHDREVQAELQAGGVLRLGVEGGLPVVHRVLAGPVDPAASVETLRYDRQRFVAVGDRSIEACLPGLTTQM